MQKIINNSISMGLYIYLSIVFFFFLTKLLSVADHSELRLVNLFFVIYFSSKLARRNIITDLGRNYLINYGSVFFTNTFAVLLSAVSFYFYLIYIDPEYVKVIENSFWLGNNLKPIKISFALLMEGMAIAVVVSLGVLQYWKINDNH